mmetsp:Transcript_37379/g.94304  ORF Transcript_37379/g.94304 Transcript_37379/m.94304 type:complete len:230 (-) Transcript_37379:920-1609(-)
MLQHADLSRMAAPLHKTTPICTQCTASHKYLLPLPSHAGQTPYPCHICIQAACCDCPIQQLPFPSVWQVILLSSAQTLAISMAWPLQQVDKCHCSQVPLLPAHHSPLEQRQQASLPVATQLLLLCSLTRCSESVCTRSCTLHSTDPPPLPRLLSRRPRPRPSCHRPPCRHRRRRGAPARRGRGRPAACRPSPRRPPAPPPCQLPLPLHGTPRPRPPACQSTPGTARPPG